MVHQNNETLSNYNEISVGIQQTFSFLYVSMDAYCLLSDMVLNEFGTSGIKVLNISNGFGCVTHAPEVPQLPESNQIKCLDLFKEFV